MPYDSAQQKNLKQLQEILQSPLIELQNKDPRSTMLYAKGFLNSSKYCCIITETATYNKKTLNIKSLYQKKRVLEKMKRKLCQDHPQVSASLVGIYPSLQDPICVYDLRSNAATYVSDNILPSGNSWLKKTARHITRTVLGVDPTVGGLALILRR